MAYYAIFISVLCETIDPLIIRLDDGWSWGTILIRTSAEKTKEALAGLEKVCRTLNPKFPFTYQFSDQEYSKLYRSEQVVSRLSNIFAFIAIFISCLGLFGLAMFTAEQRTKEIGVRKVLGASVPGIVSLLSTQFLKPVAIAMLIAFPVAWYMMNHWLLDFAYRIEIEWWIFAIAGLLTIGIALLTVSYQSIKAALGNPVRSLRTE
ncbi:MAG: FtsX-like permease family protein [Bacteroidota bacterium]